MLIELAEAFDVTLDFLAVEAQGQPAKLTIQDRELLRRCAALDGLSKQEKALAKQMLDLLILKHRDRQVAETGAA